MMQETWETIAESYEMAAKARTFDAMAEQRPRVRRAMLADCADAVADARRCRDAHEAGATLNQVLASFLMIG